MHPPVSPGDPDWVVVESTYGNRLHAKVDPFESLAKVLTTTPAIEVSHAGQRSSGLTCDLTESWVIGPGNFAASITYPLLIGEAAPR